MQKIGIFLGVVLQLLGGVENDKTLNEDIKEIITIAEEKIREASGIIDEYSSQSSTSFFSKSNKTEKERVLEGQEIRKRKFLAGIDKAIVDSMDGGNMNIECLTDCLCMSRSTLYRRVKSLTGISANEYIRRKRMELAKELLIDGNLPVSEIAYKVGCSSMSYFRQTFKDIYGVIPSEYLRNLKNS